MPNKKLKIVEISAEVAPFSKTGGLGDVARNLSKALFKLNQEVIIITPLYGQIIDIQKNNLKLLFENIKIYLNQKEAIRINYWQGYLTEGLPIYFIENRKYFSKRKTLYGSNHENARFLIFDVAALKLLSLLKFQADIIQCHDWHTGLIPYYVKNDFKNSETLRGAKTIYTIHNLAFQLGQNWWDIPLDKKDYGRVNLPLTFEPAMENINFAKRAMLWADAINTVSEQYREEIMTIKFGQDLHRILKNREDHLFGIINGIDYNAYNPNNDPGLQQNYDQTKTNLKKLNKEYLQKVFNLSQNIKTPIFCSTSRITFQKGFEIFLPIIEPLMDLDAQLIVIGAGDKKYIKELLRFQKKYPKRIAVIPSHEENQKYETLVYAGSDFILMPSHHEPCGINQLIAMRYGCIPIVRQVGGLYDTVENYNIAKNTGTGFTFKQFDSFSFYGAIERGLEIYKIKERWKELTTRAMQQSNSWEIPAQKYIKLFNKIMRSR